MAMVVDGVTAHRCRGHRLVGSQSLGIEPGRRPHREGQIGEPPRTLLDCCFVPGIELAESRVELERAFPETAGCVAFLGERAVAVLGVVAGEREIAERVQPLLLHALPLRSQRLLPCHT
jgi:hypothetical protein